MHITVKNLINLETNIQSKINDLNYKDYKPKIIAVSKTFKIDHINPLIEHGHNHFGENKVQEALNKWTNLKAKYPNVKLHLIGKLQTNKVKFAINLFDFIHSVDNEKLAKKISEEQKKQNKKVKLFIQVNIGDEDQKSGVSKKDLKNLYDYFKNLELEVMGLMCIPPLEKDANLYFKEMKTMNDELKLKDLSMGMTSDYIDAAKNSATYLRIGSKIFGSRN